MSHHLEFEINALPKRINQISGRSWFVYSNERRRWRVLVGMTLIAIGKKEFKNQKVHITFERHSSRQPDFDNLVHSFKPILDALVFHKVLIDDSPKHIESSYKWVKTPQKLGKIKVYIKPLIS